MNAGCKYEYCAWPQDHNTSSRNITWREREREKERERDADNEREGEAKLVFSKAKFTLSSLQMYKKSEIVYGI
jgi:hypothetical protein